MSFPKKGKFFPAGNGHDHGYGDRGRTCFADEIAAALRRSLGPTGAGVKTVAGWTGANEKTVKNWFAGRYGPSGEHLAVLVRHSDEVLNAFFGDGGAAGSDGSDQARCGRAGDHGIVGGSPEPDTRSGWRSHQ